MNKNFLLFNPAIIFSKINDGDYIRKVIKNLDIYTEIDVKVFSKMGLIEFEKDGRKKILKLTNKGKDIKNKLLKIRRCVESAPNVENKSN